MNILDQIGNTPLIRLERCVPANGAELWLKLEYLNPTGSMKDRMALSMIEGAERDRLIGPGTTIVEYSGGSTGPALALVCSVKGYGCVIVIADSHTEERLQLMRALGAELEVVPSVEGPPRPTAEDIRRMVERAGELATRPGYYATDQFNNPYIVAGARDGLGREIWEQTRGRVTAFCQGVGTAGSLMGIARALKPHGVHICAFEPAGSAAISGGEKGPFATQGWSGIVPPHWDPEWVDEVEQIEDQDAIDMTRRLSREEGIFAGITTGANVVGAIRLAERLGPDAVVVTLAVDTGFKYMTVAPYGEPTYATGVVGREEELATIDTFLSTAPGGPQALLLEGEPGIGKTMLWKAAVRGAQERSYAVFSVQPTDAQARRSFSALGDLLAPCLEGALPSLPDPQRRALEIALLLRPADGPPPSPRAIGLAVLGVLRDVARSQAVVVAIDDVEQLDSASAAALAFSLRQLEADPVSVIAVRRAGGAASLELDRFVRQPVGPLSLGALHRLLQRRLERAFPRPQIVRIHRMSGGNPFAALELAGARSTLAQGDELVTPARLEELVRDRLAALPPNVQEGLAELAALSEPREGSVDARQLDRAVGAGVVEVEAGRVRFTHPLLASAASGLATPTRRREIHARLAELVDDPEERSRHLALGSEGPSEEVAGALEEAARHLTGRAATTAAAELAVLAVRLTPEGERAALRRRKLIAADAHSTAGETLRVRELLAEVVSETEPSAERATAFHLLAKTRVDDLEAASDLCLRALIDADSDQAMRAKIGCDLVLLWHARGDLHRALAHAQAARAAAETVGDPRLLVRALSLVALVESLASPTISEGVLELALTLESETEHPSGSYSPHTVAGIRSMFAGELDDALAALERDHAAALDSGDVAGRPLVLAHLAELELRAGRWEDARRYAREGVELAEQEDHPERRAALLAVHARVCAHLGEIDDARALATRGAKLAGDAKAELSRLQNEAALGFVELSLQRTQEADRYLRSLPAAADRMGFVEPSATPFVFDAIEAMIEAGALDEARDHIERLEAWAGQRTSPCVRGAKRRSRGLLWAATGRLDEAEAALREALQSHEASAEPFEHARTLLALGTTLRRAKQKRAAREAIEASLAILERLGARPWADRARGELARIAGRKPSSNGLTPTEQRVAELVATGWSNKEVAAALHVTVKTVEGTLSRVYAKVGVRSRTGLARHVADRKDIETRS